MRSLDRDAAVPSRPNPYPNPNPNPNPSPTRKPTPTPTPNPLLQVWARCRLSSGA